MKIVCENCSTKYSIADEKVRGKVFKIRCKKCGHIIVVKGTASAGATPAPSSASEDAGVGQFDDKATRVFDYSGFADQPSAEATWHVVIDGGQVGPLSPDQVRAKFDAGEIDGETYIWKEGFKDWLPLTEVEDFADLAEEEDGKTELMSQEQASSMFSGSAPAAAATPAPAAATPAPAAATPAPRSTPKPASGGGLFGDAPAAATPAPRSTPKPASGGGLFGDAPAAATPAPSGGDGGLFGSPAAASPSASKGALFPDEPEPADGSPKMTGQRNENSVLFSLSNLQSLATGGGGKPSAPSAAASSGGGAKPGFASAKGGGSGLVDIRAMAATALPADQSSGGYEGFSFAAPSLAAPISAAPVLMPQAGSDRPKWLIPALVGGGVLLLLVVVLLVVVLMRGGEKKEKGGAAALAQNDHAMAGDMNPDMAADGMKPDMAADGMNPDMAADGMKPDMAADGMNPDMAADGMKPDMAADGMSGGMDAARGSARRRAGSVSSRRRHHSYGGGSHSYSSRRRSSSSPRSRPASRPASSGGGGGSSLTALLRHAGGSMSSGGGGGAASNLPKRLSSGDIRRGVGRVLGSARACYNRYRVAGTCRVRVVISGSTGRPSSVRVLGSFSGTPTGRCVQRAFRRSKYRKFQAGSQSFVFPLIFR